MIDQIDETDQMKRQGKDLTLGVIQPPEETILHSSFTEHREKASAYFKRAGGFCRNRREFMVSGKIAGSSINSMNPMNAFTHDLTPMTHDPIDSMDTMDTMDNVLYSSTRNLSSGGSTQEDPKLETVFLWTLEPLRDVVPYPPACMPYGQEAGTESWDPVFQMTQKATSKQRPVGADWKCWKFKKGRMSKWKR